MPPYSIGVDLRALVPQATGIGVYTRSLLDHLTPPGEGAFRYIGMAHKPPREADRLRGRGIDLETQKAPNGLFWQQLRLPKRLGVGDLDLFWSPLSILPRRCPLPSVVTVYDLTVMLLPEAHRLKIRLSQMPFLRSTMEEANRIVAISESTANDIRFHFPQAAERVRVAPTGIDRDFQPGQPDEIEATRQRLGCPEGYLLYLGTIEPRKNLGVLLDAWEALRKENPEATPPLVLAGGYGWRSRDLMRRIQGLAGQGLHHLGRLERGELVKVMQAATLFVYPSLYEGFGLPPAEAMACGVPVVVSNTSSLPEVVGKAGIQIDPRDPHQLALTIQQLLRKPEHRRRLATAGLERSAQFTWERTAKVMEQVFEEALGEGPAD